MSSLTGPVDMPAHSDLNGLSDSIRREAPARPGVYLF